MRWISVCAAIVGGLVAGVASPAPGPADDERAAGASQANLKRIGLAFYALQEAGGTLPVDVVDKAGRPLLSWRVAILPHLGEEKLFKRFRLDEPWDSEANKKLVGEIPKVYAPVRGKAAAGETFYQTFVGNDALFGPGKLALKLPDDTPDGPANTALVAEAGQPVVWTKPEDIAFDPRRAVPKLGGLFGGECHVLLADGAVVRLKGDPDEVELKKLIMPADGQAIVIGRLVK